MASELQLFLPTKFADRQIRIDVFYSVKSREMSCISFNCLQEVLQFIQHTFPAGGIFFLQAKAHCNVK
jgi:hypothetical protein